MQSSINTHYHTLRLTQYHVIHSLPKLERWTYYVISYLPHPSDRTSYLQNYPEICSGSGQTRWRNGSNIRGTGRKRSRHTWDLKIYPEYGNFLLGYTLSGRKKKFEIGKSSAKLPTFQSNLWSSTLSVKIIYHAVGGRALYGNTKHFRNISAFYLQINVRCYM